MVTKIPSPFASPFTKTILVVGWLAYFGMLIALAVGHDVNLLIIVAWWSFVLPWITWNFLGGVQVQPGESVGGGPMFRRVDLEPGEVVEFAAPAFFGRFPLFGGHVFVTDRRVIALGTRLMGSSRTVELSDVTSVEVESKGMGWPLPRQLVRLNLVEGSLTLRPWAAGQQIGGSRLASFMGVLGLQEFVEGLAAALAKGGATIPEIPR